MSGSDLQISHCADGLLMAMLGPVCVALWDTKPTPALFEIQRAQLAVAVDRNPGKVAFMCAVSEHARPPDEAERAASSAMISGHGSSLVAVAGVIEGAGFRAAITRTVLSGIAFVARSPTPIRMFETVELAAPWLSQQLGCHPLSTLPAQFELARSKLSSGGSRPEIQNAQP